MYAIFCLLKITFISSRQKIDFYGIYYKTHFLGDKCHQISIFLEIVKNIKKCPMGLTAQGLDFLTLKFKIEKKSFLNSCQKLYKRARHLIQMSITTNLKPKNEVL